MPVAIITFLAIAQAGGMVWFLSGIRKSKDS